MTSMQPVLWVLQESLSSGRSPIPISFANMGKPAWVLLLCGLLVVVLAAVAAKRIRSGDPDEQARGRATTDVVLFWGVCAAALGFFSTALSLINVATSVLMMDRVDLYFVLGVGRLSLAATALGLLIFLVSAFLWLGLRRWHRRAVAA